MKLRDRFIERFWLSQQNDEFRNLIELRDVETSVVSFQTITRTFID